MASKTQILSHLVTWLTLGVGTALMCLAAIAAWLYYQPQHPNYIPLNPTSHHVYLTDSNFIKIYREFEVKRKTTFTITRELKQIRQDGVVVRIELPPTVVSYEPGIYKVERTVEVPPNLQGKYSLHFTVCWKQTPLKDVCIDLPVIILDA